MKRSFQYAVLALALVAGGFAAQDQSRPATSGEQHRLLLRELQGASAGYFQTTNHAERGAIVARVDAATVKLLELVEKNPNEPFALDALTQVVTQDYWLNTHTPHPGWGTNSPQAKAIGLLLRDHVQSGRLVETCKRVNFGFRQECETFLRAVLDQNPHRDVQGAACLRLAQLLAGRVEKLEVIKDQPELARRYEGLFGKDHMDALRARNPATVMKEAEAFYEQADEKYSDVTLPYNETVGEVARTDLFEIRHLSAGRQAPDIEGTDQEGRPFKLSEHRGKVVLLYFWSEF